MKLLFVSGRITASTLFAYHKNVEHADNIALKLRKKGFAIFCPHKNSEWQTGALHRDPEDDFEAWMERDKLILSRCDGVYMLRGWRQSRGSKIEHAYTKELGLEIYYEEKGDLIGNDKVRQKPQV